MLLSTDKKLLCLNNKFNFLTDEKTQNMYSFIRSNQLQKLASLEDLDLKYLDWASCLIAYKETKD